MTWLLPCKCLQKTWEEILLLQRACYREHNSLVFLPRCTLSLLSVHTAYLLPQSLTILVGPEISWNKSKMKCEWKPTRGVTVAREWTGAQTGAPLWRTVDRPLAVTQGALPVTVQRNSRPSGVDFSHSLLSSALAYSLCPRLLVPSQIKDTHKDWASIFFF